MTHPRVRCLVFSASLRRDSLNGRLARLAARTISLAQAHEAFDAGGRVADSQLAERFAQTIAGFMDLAEAAKHYPYVRRAWVEYLGERPDPAIDRVE